MAVAASQMRAVLSSDAVTMRNPSGLKAADNNTEGPWPWLTKNLLYLAVAASEMRAMWSVDVVTMRDPSGL